MPIPEWEINTDLLSAISWTLDIATPINGDGSLLVQYTNSVAVGTLNAIPTLLSGYPEGFTTAKLRTSFEIKAFPGSIPTSVTYFGIVGMQGTRNITGTDAVGRTFYALAVRIEEGLGVQQLQIIRVSDVGLRGLQNLASGTVIASITYPVVLSVGSIGTLEFQWVVDIPNLNGVYMVARTGSNPNYSDLTDRISILDFTSPLTSTVGEGLFCYLKNSVGSDTKQITFDDTTLYSLI